MLASPLSASMRFTEAAERFLASRATINAGRRVQFLSKRTLEDYASQIGMAEQFFGQLRLDEIHGGHFRIYQENRANGVEFTRMLRRRVCSSGTDRTSRKFEVPTRAGAAKINDELGLVRRIMVAAGAWTPQLQAKYLLLQEFDAEIPRALSPEEEEVFLATAASRESWKVIYWYSLVALHTTFSSDEMRTIRQGDINIPQGVLAVNRRYGKNKGRRRTVPLVNGECLWALERLLERSVELGGRGPNLYLFPLRIVRGSYDGNSPISRTGLRKDFEAVRDHAGVPWFCINGWRHTAITRMAEDGVPIAIIMSRAGHMTAKMSAHYTHISEQVQRRRMMEMEMGKRRPVVSIGTPSRRYGSAG